MKKMNSILWAVLMPVLILFVSSASAQSISSQTVTTAYQSAYSAYWGEVHSTTTGDAQTTGKSLYGTIETTLPALTDFWLETTLQTGDLHMQHRYTIRVYLSARGMMEATLVSAFRIMPVRRESPFHGQLTMMDRFLFVWTSIPTVMEQVEQLI